MLCRELGEWAAFRAFHFGIVWSLLNNTVLLNSGVEEKERSIKYGTICARLFCLSADDTKSVDKQNLMWYVVYRVNQTIRNEIKRKITKQKKLIKQSYPRRQEQSPPVPSAGAASLQSGRIHASRSLPLGP